MKKMLFSLLAVTALTVSLTSCGGEKKLTEEEVQKKIEEGVAAKKDAIAKEEDDLCKQKFDGMVASAADSIVAAAKATPPAGK
jgi:hypothetical protein